jgi:hypothetical protein
MSTPRHTGLFELAWRRIERRMDRYPAPLREQAHALLARIPRPRRRYFSSVQAAPLLHFPVWAAPTLEREALLRLLEPTALLYFFVRIQDDVLDELGTRGHLPRLLLGNVLLWDALEQLREEVTLPAFWQRAKSAWQTFSAATEMERRQLFEAEPNARTRYSERAFRAHARKTAMAEIPLYAALARAGRWHRAPDVPGFVHCLGEAYGLVNDLVGFERDVRAGAQTYLLARVRRHVPALAWRDVGAMGAALVLSSHADRLFERVRELHGQARRRASRLGLAGFEEFMRARESYLRRLERQLLAARAIAVIAQSSAAEKRDNDMVRTARARK